VSSYIEEKLRFGLFVRFRSCGHSKQLATLRSCTCTLPFTPDTIYLTDTASTPLSDRLLALANRISK
jgi:hypothetical protein